MAVPLLRSRCPALFGVALLIGLLGLGATPATADAAPDSLTVRFGNTTTSLSVLAVSRMPGTTARLTATPRTNTDSLHVTGSHHHITALGPNKWRVHVPSEPGLYPLTVTAPDSSASVRLQVFVLTPWNSRRQSLNGYEIGRYEQTARNGNPRYKPPKGFIRVTKENRHTRVSPHFRLGQFLCGSPDRLPQYILLKPRLLTVLERTLTALNERGYALSTLFIMSGYRTPAYNRAIGNTTEYSRHLYGDAADIFVDADGDEWMDDLTGDGRATRADARALAAIVRTVPTEARDKFVGGLGIYGAASHRGPFVHVDLRGRQARW